MHSQATGLGDRMSVREVNSVSPGVQNRVFIELGSRTQIPASEEAAIPARDSSSLPGFQLPPSRIPPPQPTFRRG